MKKAAGWLGVALGLALLYVFFAYFFDFEQALAHAAAADRSLLAWSVLFLIASMAVRCVKWALIVRASTSLEWRTGFHITLAATLANFLFPVRLGEILRLYLAREVASVPYATSVAATLVDRFSGLLVLMAVFFLYPFAEFKGVDASRYWWIFVLIGVSGVLVLLFGHLLAASIAPLKRWLSPRMIDFCVRALASCHLPGYGWRVSAAIFGLSFLFVLGDAVTYWLLLHAFGLEITLLQSIVAATLFNFAFVLPSAPGQLGLAEVLPVLIFAYGFGLSRDVVASSALLWHFLSAVVIAGLGGYSAWRLGALRLYRADLKVKP